MLAHQIAGALAALVAMAAAPREEGAALFNGSDLSGWTGATHMYVADATEPGVLRCEQARIDEWKTCNLFTEREYGDFVLSFECNMAKGANNGVGIRMPAKIKGEPAWESFCEVQLIDDDSSPRLKPHQHTGSVYGVIRTGATRSRAANGRSTRSVSSARRSRCGSTDGLRRKAISRSGGATATRSTASPIRVCIGRAGASVSSGTTPTGRPRT